MSIVLVANGEIEDKVWAASVLQEATVIVAADGGAGHLLALGFRPELVIGDLDSFPAGQQPHLEAAGTRFIIAPRAKDETDLELALLYLADHYQEEIAVLASLGGRLDQTLANLMLLAHPKLRSRPVRLLTPFQTAWLITHFSQIEGEIGDLLSLIPFADKVVVTATTGLQWPLHQETLYFGPARGISNVLTQNKATITIQSGFLLCVHTTKRWQR